MNADTTEVIWDEARIIKLIDDGVEESLTLDYKAAGALRKTDGKRKEITKDVSAMANSAGGLIIYGVSEFQERDKQHLPSHIDPINTNEISKEWLEHVIGNIRPRIHDVLIHPVPLSGATNHAAYVVEVKQSVVAHQATDKRYYRRYNFESVAMEDYEISDVRNRWQRADHLVSFDAQIHKTFLVIFVVKNEGKLAAHDVSFQFSPEPHWKKEKPAMFSNGVRSIPSGKMFKFPYRAYKELLGDDDIPKSFDVRVSYYHPQIGGRFEETFHIDFMDYHWTLDSGSALEQQTQQLKKSLDGLTSEVKVLNKSVKSFLPIANPTGLNLSASTIQSIQSIQQGKVALKKRNPSHCGYNIFQEILGVDSDMAFRLYRHDWDDKESSIADIEGMTDEIMKDLYLYFNVPDVG
jgi:hypothetical protein